MRLGSCTYQQCGKPARLKYEQRQRLCAAHLEHFELLARRREGLAEALRICLAVRRRMSERDRVALTVAIDRIRAAIKKTRKVNER